MRKTILTALGTLALAGCATLFAKNTKPVGMVSTPVGAEVWINGQQHGVTPLTLDLNNHVGHMVTFKMAGHQDVTCQLTTSIGAVWIILDVLGGLIPIIVDASTGEWKSLNQESCNANLPKISGVRSTGPDGEVRYVLD